MLNRKNTIENQLDTYKDLVIELQDKLIKSYETIISAKNKIKGLTKHEKELLREVEEYRNKKRK